MPEIQRYNEGARAAWAGIVANLLLTALKIFAGIYGHSKAMLADGVHSASDVAASAAVLIGFRIGKMPADDCHPYGHAKAESISAKIVAILLLLAGLQIAGMSLRSLIAGQTTVPSGLALWTAALSITIKEALYRYKLGVGRRINSSAVVANAWEHRSDALSSVAALAGIAGARLGFPFLDPLAGAVVSLVVIRIGMRIAAEAAGELMDRSADVRVVERIRGLALTVSGVEALHEVRTRPMGPDVLVDLKIGVDARTDLVQSHEIAHRVKETLIRGIKEVKDVMVHVDPVERDRS